MRGFLGPWLCKNVAALPASSSLHCSKAIIQYSEEHNCLLNHHNYLLVLKRGLEIASNWWADLSLHEGLFSCYRVMTGRGADDFLLFFDNHHAVQGTASNLPSLHCSFRRSLKALVVRWHWRKRSLSPFLFSCFSLRLLCPAVPSFPSVQCFTKVIQLANAFL